MKEIEGVNLADLLSDEEKVLKSERIAKAKKQINGILLNIEQWLHQRGKLAKETAKNEEKLTKAYAKLEEVKKGNWSVLAEENEGQNKQKPQEQDD